MYCKKCGTYVREGKFCPTCGERLDGENTSGNNDSKCGSAIDTTSKNISKDQTSKTIYSPTNTAYYSTEDIRAGNSQNYEAKTRREDHQYNHGTKRINKIGYLLIIFFLGWLGIHKFLNGRILAGVSYLILGFFGIGSILVLVDFVADLFLHSDVDGRIEIPQGFFL